MILNPGSVEHQPGPESWMKNIKQFLDLLGLLYRVRVLRRYVLAPSDLLRLYKCKLSGGSYTDFYTLRMDRLAVDLGENVNGPPEAKKFHLEYLMRKGLQKTPMLLDYGCGALASGIHSLIPWEKHLSKNRSRLRRAFGYCVNPFTDRPLRIGNE